MYDYYLIRKSKSAGNSRPQEHTQLRQPTKRSSLDAPRQRCQAQSGGLGHCQNANLSSGSSLKTVCGLRIGWQGGDGLTRLHAPSAEES